MNYSFIIFALSTLLTIPITNYPQSRTQPVRNVEIVRSTPKRLKSISDKSDQQDSKNIKPIKIRDTQKLSPNPLNTPQKNFSQRPPKLKQPQKKKKQVITEEYEEIIEPIYIIEETIIYNDIRPEVGYWEIQNNSPEEIQIVDFSYPDFPLRFSNAEIFYQFTHKNNDYYKILIKIEATYDNYFNAFGVLIKYDEDLEQLVLFNEDHEILRSGENYKFSKQINIEHTGYINLRLGFYEEEEKVFYPEELYPNRTDKLIFLERVEKIYINENASNF